MEIESARRAQDAPATGVPQGVLPPPAASASTSRQAEDRDSQQDDDAERGAAAPDAAEQQPVDTYPRVQRYSADGRRLAPRIRDGNRRVGPRGYPYPTLRDSDIDVLYRYRGLIDLDALLDAYELGRADERDDVARAFNERDMNRRMQRALSAHQKAVALGVARLQEGNYPEAVVALSLAAELDQGDPACRIHLAQARVALRQYEAAATVLRRALELQPRLAYLPLNLREYYPEPADYDRQVDELVRHVVAAEHPTSGACFLLGVLEFQRGRFREAHIAFRYVARQSGRDDLTARYLELTLPMRRAAR